MRELVERARDGDHDAFTRLVVDRADHLFATAYLTLRSRDRAEDAVQEACLRAWRDLPALRDADRFDAWLRRLLMNACVDQLRRERRRPTDLAFDPGRAPSTPDVSSAIADADALSRAFLRLSPRQRAVIVLSHFEDLTTSEIAAALDIPAGTVKSRLHHALRALRAALDADARAPASRTEMTR
jgi:RNA polymerase sigma-70 factor (ECF subfamily)